MILLTYFSHHGSRGDLGGHLGCGQQPAEARLGALAELDLQGPNRRAGHHVLELVHVESAFGVAAAEVGGTDLEDQFAAVAVIARNAALTGVVQAVGQHGAPVEGLDGAAGQ